MKNVGLFYLLLLPNIFSCQKNTDIIIPETIVNNVEVVEIELNGVVRPYHLGEWRHYTPIQDVTVSLVYDNIILDEVNTDLNGSYFFAPQPVPLEGAHIVIEASGFFPNIQKIYPPDSYLSEIILLPNMFQNLNSLNDYIPEQKVSISGKIHESDLAPPQDALTIYAVNEAQEIIGYCRPNSDIIDFSLTTIANQSVTLMFHNVCGVFDTIQLGVLTEDIVLDDILYEQTIEWIEINGQVADCNNESFTGYLNFHYNERTNFFNSGFRSGGRFGSSWINACEIEGTQVLVSFVDYDYDFVGFTTVPYTAGQDISVDINECETNQTYFRYTLDGGMLVNDPSFTFVNIIENEGVYFFVDRSGSCDIGGKFAESTTGTVSSGNMLFRTIGGVGVEQAAKDLPFNILSNDGDYIQGTFSGTLLDDQEYSLGQIEGSFKAKIF